jgi:nitroreductase
MAISRVPQFWLWNKIDVIEQTTMNVKNLITGRRTIYDFKPEPVPVEKIKQAIDVARWAPNHHLTEPWHFYLLGPETIKSIIELNTQIIREKYGDEAANAKQQRWSKISGWLVVTCDKSADQRLMQEDYAACCCAIQNMMLYLWSENIGVKWSTGKVTRDPRFFDLLWIDQNAETVVGLFWYGYAEETPQAARKQTEQITIELP